MTRVAIIQSNYIPWKGYFDFIAAVDHFILYDDVQYTRRDWRNRNLIQTPQGPTWLTVPVKVKGRYHQTIRETEIDGSAWADAHWKAFHHCYRRAPHFHEVAAMLEPVYRARTHTHLSALNRALIEAVCRYLGITTKITCSADYALAPGQSQRLADLCAKAGGTEYVSGPAAKAYLDESCFTDLAIRLSWFEYGEYPEYPQLWTPFTHQVSIVDLLFNCGREAPHYMHHVMQ